MEEKEIKIIPETYEEEIKLGEESTIVEEITGGTRDYNKLNNKPLVNDVELIGNRTFEDLGMRPITNEEILKIVNVKENENE